MNTKKIILPVLAVIAAVALTIGMSAFGNKQSVHSLSTITFYYTGTSYSDTDVENLANWSSIVTPPECDGAQNKACQMDVDIEYTHISGGNRVLNTIPSQGTVFSLQTELGNDNLNYVPDLNTPGVENRVNKP